MIDNVSCCLPQDASFKTYDDVMRHLDGLGVFHMDMGLGRMERALSALGLDRPLRPTVQRDTCVFLPMDRYLPRPAALFTQMLQETATTY